MATMVSNWMRLFSAAGVVALLQLSGSRAAEPEKSDDAAAQRLEFIRRVRRFRNSTYR